MRCLIVGYRLVALLLALTVAESCGGRPPAPDAGKVETARPDVMELPSGDVAGAAQSMVGAEVRNPLEGQAAAVVDGKRLFEQMNCAGCHDYSLRGGMGPNLADNYWRYGGTPAAVYQSIAAGRPQGMPAWYKALPPQEIWQLVSYIESYGGTMNPEQYHAGLQGDVSSKQSSRP